ncbi:MAG: homocysteine S-methyltransferase family protein [Lachnospiraceae bacterium]|nr:homocysteine S-methyltransferase family protein [Lachnospiraceae bacterium]
MDLHFPLILDGATGTQLQQRGFDGSICSETWILQHPQVLKDFQESYIQAGSNILYAPTFGANRVRLEENGVTGQVEEYNQKLVALTRETAAGRAWVAGDIAPAGKYLPPMGDTSFEELVDIYTEQVKGLEAGGVDLYVIETMMSIAEARAAVLAVKSMSAKPVFVSFTCTTNGKTLSGEDMVAALITLQNMSIDAFGLNCSVGPEDMCRQLNRLSEFAQVPLIAKPNAGMPEMVDGKAVYLCAPEEYTRQMESLAAAGVCIFGGCCGSDASHIRAMAEKADSLTMTKPSDQHRGEILAATNRSYFIVDSAASAPAPFRCDASLMEHLEEAAEEEGASVSIRISSEADLNEFAECQHAVNGPLFLFCEDAALLEKALRLFQGRALYEGSLPEEALIPLEKQYGLIL